MNHTFLKDAVTWDATGVFIDKTGEEVPATGRVTVIHNKKEWSIHSFIHIRENMNLCLKSERKVYSTENPTILHWISAKENLEGTYDFVGNTIVSTYISSEQQYGGVETYARISDDCYDAIGVTFGNGAKMASWSMRLERLKKKNDN